MEAKVISKKILIIGEDEDMWYVVKSGHKNLNKEQLYLVVSEDAHFSTPTVKYMSMKEINKKFKLDLKE